MESSDQFNFSLFRPRNLHGRKNRNVILNMLLVWAVAVFGFQILLRIIEKPTPEKALADFNSVWPDATVRDLKTVNYQTLLNSLILVKGKNMVNTDDQMILNKAISTITFNVAPDSLKSKMLSEISEIKELKSKIALSDGQEFLDIKSSILTLEKGFSENTALFTGLKSGSLEEKIYTASLTDEYPAALSDASLDRLPEIMKLYLTHNQSVLTDTLFLGFPFHYFYTAIFLLILFIGLCILYNVLIEWRLKKEGVTE